MLAELAKANIRYYQRPLYLSLSKQVIFERIFHSIAELYAQRLFLVETQFIKSKFN